MKKRLLLWFVALQVCACSNPFTFVHMTDTQIGFHDNSEGFIRTDSLMQHAVTAANALHPDLVIITGDLINDPADTLQNDIFERNLQAVAQAPVWVLPGNHDVRNYSREKHDAYVALRGYDRFSFRHKGCAFIGIDSNCIKAGDEEAEQQQWIWLTEELKQARGAKQIFVFLHCPILRESIEEPEDYFNFDREKRQGYIDLFRENGVSAVFAGHTHCPYQTEIDGIRFYTGTAVGNCLEHGEPGFYAVAVDRKGFEVKLVL